MKFLLFCEGKTERTALPDFLKRWLDPRLTRRVGVSTVKFEGWRDLYDEVAKKAHLRLRESDIIAVISLLDLYGPTFYPNGITSAQQRFVWAKDHMERKVAHERFYQFFAVHETEAWLLSDPGLFPPKVEQALVARTNQPESVNFHEPPSKLLNHLYEQHTRRAYKKATQGKQLFGKLSPDTAHSKCPHLQEMLDKMLELAKLAGL